MKVIITKNYDEMSKVAAWEVAKLIKEKPDCILGLATGSTPEGMYSNLVLMNRVGQIDFSKVTSFNLDEYRGLKGDHPQSYRYFMDNKLFNHVNINKNNTFVPSGVAEDMQKECIEYDERIRNAGGIDLQVLGIGGNGHIGFNEPDSFLHMGTHLTPLTKETIEANARFFENEDEVPKEAITMGLGSIMKARKILLLANGKKKASIISKLVDGKINTEIPASILQVHNNVIVVVDEDAAAELNLNITTNVEIVK